MGLKDLDLKISYDSDIDDILNDFYIPALSNSIKYKRSVGFFSSKSLAVAAEGISNFITNGGNMELICGTKLKGKDLDIIKKAHRNPEEVIEEFFLDELENLEEGFVNDHVRALGWMVANGRLKLKIAIIMDENGIPLEENKGILHQKIGILKDIDGNCISFSGSNNETAAGWINNVEEFKVFRSFKEHEMEYQKTDDKKFNDLWNGKSKRMRVIDSPTAIKEKLMKIAPEKIEDLKLNEKFTDKEKEITKKIKLWDYQNEAIKNWIENNKNGIFEMATGTGKTFTALGCLSKELENNEKLLVVISCPYQHLVQQWKHSVNKFGINFDEIIVADSSNSSWKRNLEDYLLDMSLDDKNLLLVLTTHSTFSNDKFTQIIKNKTDNIPIFLIADEVHGLGAEISSKGLIGEYDYRLGLSATPRRWFDELGTDAIYNYFDKVVYEFSLQRAVNTVNEATGETYLTPYEYLPRFISLETEELEEYIKKTKAIATKYYSSNKSNKKEILQSLLFSRSNIAKNAKQKYKSLESILNEMDEIECLIIYCSPQQINNVMEIINKKRLPGHRFTMAEGTKEKKEYQGFSEREYILKKFGDGEYKVLVAMKCLDEGVDVPAARAAIFMSSSGNPREYIQRIGRVIRRFPGKKKALIYDMVVAPASKKADPQVREIENRVFDKEFERYEDIAKVAINNIQALDTIFKIRNKVV